MHVPMHCANQSYADDRVICRDFFDSYDEKPERSQVAVFDIDETALSNRAEWLTSLQRVSFLLA